MDYEDSDKWIIDQIILFLTYINKISYKNMVVGFAKYNYFLPFSKMFCVKENYVCVCVRV